ncbi:type VI secretion system baseplate subunit TssF [Azospirillum sp. ST 5-10]|uniref:type VI secretion system baseplate subunit TssF n=1 Tax=unclassified Azospirillum TaxID=2630922 RepID=UPI003F49CE1C
MTFNRYFQDELFYLRSLGAEFARENPNLAPFLARESNDPDVERLLEGFAFLSGRLRQKLDDELPEVAHSFVDMLWPHHLRPVPAMSIVQFTPVPGAVSGGETIARGTYLDAAPIDGTACRFRTVYPVRLMPLSVGELSISSTATASELHLRLDLMEGMTWAAAGADRLRLYIDAERDPLIGRTLYLWLNRQVAGLQAEVGGTTVALPRGRVEPVGLAADDLLLPQGATSFPGFSLLQDYFAFPGKLMFVELAGLEPLARAGGRSAVLRIRFNRPMPAEVRTHRGLLAPNCTPVVNLFARDADPIRLDDTKVEHRLRVSGADPRHYEVFSIDRVEGLARGRGERIPYPAFESLAAHAGGRTYHRRRLRASTTDRQVDTWISFVDSGDRPATPDAEVVAVAVTCSNGALGALVPVGGISRPTSSAPTYATFRNIAPCTQSYPPPVERGLLWRLISAVSLNHLSLTRIDALRAVLAIHDRPAIFDARARDRQELMLGGIQAVTAEPRHWLVRGIPVRLVDVTLTVAESRFGGLGEVFLFGSVYDRFLTEYASINAMHRLTVRAVESNTEFQWTPTSGQHPML